MNIREIILYSHSGEMRRIPFKVNGLNIVTGRSSTGKSALSDIVEYCMGQSDYNIPEGPIRDKVSWYAVVFQFRGEQVMIAKPTPAPNASSCSRAMIRRGATVEPPPLAELRQNADDEAVISVLSGLLGIPANRTEVIVVSSRMPPWCMASSRAPAGPNQPEFPDVPEGYWTGMSGWPPSNARASVCAGIGEGSTA